MEDIFWIKGDPPPGLAVVLPPRGNDRLVAELDRMKQAGITTLVSMVEKDEADWLGLAEEGALAEQIGIEFISFPIPDRHTPPNLGSFRSFVADLATRLRNGEKVGVHCRGSIGRATLASACTLIELGWPPHAALAAIEEARGCEVPDTPEQEAWILRYQATP